ncbi:MAG: fibrobacter succinogenes major paralogous domain-containing protein [Fibrobacter sp.]|nr:fibrobacter succinogenes major paralogous domain-containing protein [Fibrobacter sp.]
MSISLKVLLILFAFAMLAACSGDHSKELLLPDEDDSYVSEDETLSSSSHEIDRNCLSSENKNSSSSTKKSSSSRASSSSSIQKAKSSSSKKSSSSTAKSSSSETKKSSSSHFKENWKYLNPDISYGEMTDSRDGQVYKTVEIGEQLWMAENLNYEVDESFCYNDSSEYCAKYGRLYKWAAALGMPDSLCGYRHRCPLPSGDIQGVCPSGWHLPSVDDWQTLFGAIDDEYEREEKCYCDTQKGGLSLKATSGWIIFDFPECEFDMNEEGVCLDEFGVPMLPPGIYDGNGTDSFGFSALPGGVLYMEHPQNPRIYGWEEDANFWTSTEGNDSLYAFNMVIYGIGDDEEGRGPDKAQIVSEQKSMGMSVRCVKD